MRSEVISFFSLFLFFILLPRACACGARCCTSDHARGEKERQATACKVCVCVCMCVCVCVCVCVCMCVYVCMYTTHTHAHRMYVCMLYVHTHTHSHTTRGGEPRAAIWAAMQSLMHSVDRIEKKQSAMEKVVKKVHLQFWKIAYVRSCVCVCVCVFVCVCVRARAYTVFFVLLSPMVKAHKESAE